jgi:hydroxyacylglutathione hydrolase
MTETVAPSVRRVLAPNPSPFTGAGTNTWLVGDRRLAVIDPGPEDARHLDAILRAAGRGRITAIVVTHAHADHTGLARRLADATGAPVHAFGDARAGLDPAIAALGDLGGGEGVDAGFAPDVILPDGGVVADEGWRLTALHTPGHMGNHIALAMGDLLFSGDHAMGWATSIVSPPEGDMGAYMASLDRLIARGPVRLLPGHGGPVADGAARLAALRDHRRAREAAIRAALAAGAHTPAAIVAAVYADVPPALHPAALRNVLAHLIDLVQRDLAEAPEGLAPDAPFLPRHA